jgi:RNA processing factor Prp31
LDKIAKLLSQKSPVKETDIKNPQKEVKSVEEFFASSKLESQNDSVLKIVQAETRSLLSQITTMLGSAVGEYYSLDDKDSEELMKHYTKSLVEKKYQKHQGQDYNNANDSNKGIGQIKEIIELIGKALDPGVDLDTYGATFSELKKAIKGALKDPHSKIAADFFDALNNRFEVISKKNKD